MTQQVKSEETSEEQSTRLKKEAHNTIDRLWTWAQSGRIFGSVEIKIPFDDGIPQRIYVIPTEVKT